MNIPIYDKNGDIVQSIHIDDTIQFVDGRVCKGEKYYYKGIGIPYTQHHILPEDMSDEYNLIEKSDVFYIGNAVSKKVYPIFKEKPEEAGTNWSRWYKVLTEKMTSGDVIQVAEVVRDLTHAQINKGISPALKRMLAKARTTLASEIACALKVDEETAIAKINQHLPEEDPEDGL